jgi:hypothetical protein
VLVSPIYLLVTAGGNANARYQGVVAAAHDWNTALSKIVFVVLPLGSVAQDAPEGAPVVPVDLQASAAQVYTAGDAPGPAPSPSSSSDTSAYTEVWTTGPVKGGTITRAAVWVYFADPDNDIEGIMTHELMRCLGAISGAAPDPGDVLYPVGTHGRLSQADVATIALIYTIASN